MKLYICALLQLFGIFAFLIGSSTVTGVNDIRLGNDEVNFKENQKWILQRKTVLKRNAQNRRGKVKLQEKIRKRKRMRDLKSKKRKEHGRARKDWRKGQTENGKKGHLRKALGGKNGYNTTSCLEKVFAYSRLNVQKASTISRQVKRISDVDDLQNKKWKKRSAFNSTTKRLLSALGGDASIPTCRGQPFSSTPAISNTTATFTQDTLATLLQCEEDIAEKCRNLVTGNSSKKAELEACKTLADNFKSDFQECFTPKNKTIEDSCLCTEAISESEVELLEACDVNKEFKEAVKAKDECFRAFSKCKKAEVAAVEGIDTCKDFGKESSLEEELFANMHIFICIPRCLSIEYRSNNQDSVIKNLAHHRIQ